MKPRRAHCHSLRDLLLVIIVVAVLSALLTYQLTTHLPTKSQAELTILLEERNYHLDKRRGLEGIDLEKHPAPNQRPLSPQWDNKDQLDLAVVTQKIKKLEEDWFGRGSDCQAAVVQPDREEEVVVVQTSAQYSYTQLFSRLNCHLLQSKDIATLKRKENTIVWVTGNLNSTNDQKLSQLYTSGAKVNHIPRLQTVFKSKENLCEIGQTLTNVAGIDVEWIIPRCYELPGQYGDFVRAQSLDGYRNKWVYKSLGPGEKKLHLLDMDNDVQKETIQSWSSDPGILQEYFGSPLLFYGMPFELKAYVLVTSLSPLRAYVHTEGVIQSRYDYQKYFQKINGRTWRFSQLRAYIAQTHSTKKAEVMVFNTHSLILQSLLILDTKTLNASNTTKCAHCFQLLEFDIIFNSSFHPVILEVITNPRMDIYPQQKDVLKDLASILTANLPVYKDIAMMYKDLRLHLTKKSDSCYKEEGYLSEADLRFLMVTRKEYLNRGKFNMIYPSVSSDTYTSFINALKQYQSNLRTSDSEPSVPHSTAGLHSSLTVIMKYFSNRDLMGDSYDDLTLFHTPSHPLPGLFQSARVDKQTNTEAAYNRKYCSQDLTSMPYLQSYHTEPSLNFTYMFRANVTDYYTSVPYSQLLVKIWAFADYCYSEARMEHKFGVARPSLYSLGVGMNRMLIQVVDTTHTEPWIVSTYTLHIERRGPAGGGEQAGSDREAQACSLVQDCDLKFIPQVLCGLHNSSYHSWTDFLSKRAKLPACVYGDTPGEWLFPCATCSEAKTCKWDRGIWQPHTCSHPVMSPAKLKQCLAGKQVVFIGDSTNRGMMHYMIEKVNGSLTEWDKTHQMKLYSNINGDRTAFSFGYYPQFWLPANQRPVFDKALYELLKQSGPVQNNHNTVLVVGGVHWLSTHHLRVLSEALTREGLSGVKVIMKGLGAGFHQPVDGLHCLTLREQRHLLLHNQQLIRLARGLGYGVVDTFNMTMARYKHFLQGKCACHFHTVKEILPSFTAYLKTSSQRNKTSYSDMPIHYHIEGEINSAYSEILTNYMCN